VCRGALLAARPRVETTRHHKLAPGLHVSPDGGHIAATERELTHYDSAGAIVRTEPNSVQSVQLVGAPLTLRSVAKAYLEADFEGDPGHRLKMPTKNGDDAIFETYLQHAMRPATTAARSSGISRSKVLKARASAKRSDGLMPPSIWRSKRGG
jgi:hypothetical protein